jgi:hypothetical protein
MEKQEQPEYAQVDIRLLQEIVNYMSQQPYNEVYRFIDILTGKTNFETSTNQGENNG